MSDTLSSWQAFLIETIIVLCVTGLVIHKDCDITIWVAIVGPMAGARWATRGAKTGANAVIAGNSMRPVPYSLPDASDIPAFKPPPQVPPNT
jgi:hypothetical protein